MKDLFNIAWVAQLARGSRFNAGFQIVRNIEIFRLNSQTVVGSSPTPSLP